MNDHEAERIADALTHLRPDWPVKQLRTLLADPRIAGRPRRDVVVALAWVASEPGTASPYRVLEAGPWWRAATVLGDSVTVEHLAPGESCRACGKPQQRCQANPYAEHDFEPDFRRPRDVDIAPVVAELKGLARPSPRPEATEHARGVEGVSA
jgi:hypothetical protein